MAPTSSQDHHRRRQRHGPPLCSTTFGGNTVPPLFGGGGGAPPAGAIFLRSTSNFYNKTVDGTPFNVVAPTRNVDDSLYFLKAGFGQNLAAPAGWTALPAYTFNFLQIYKRLATDTAADDFLITEPTTRPIVGQMAVFGNTLGEDTLLVIYQGGSLTNNTGGAGQTTYIVGNLAAGPVKANNLVIGWWGRGRGFGINGAVPSIGQPGFLANDIGSIAVNQPGTAPEIGRLYVGWEWEAEAGASPLITGGTITYSPIEDFSVTTTQMQRLEYPP